ncbi:hypothetical protein [Dokdonella sp.]|uniref:hypothetical protein n=1 Tax=Dokdonella sp. TaxID=2291710 RepID=UPI0031C17E6C|nr:hypothetical protein [Dokdonella sp.]
MKPFRIVLIAVAALIVSGTAPAGDLWEHSLKEAADATWHSPLASDGNEALATPVTDIDLDWSKAFWPSGSLLKAQPLAIRRYRELAGLNPITFRTFTYMLLQQRRADGYFDALALKLDEDGAAVLSFGNNGFKRVAAGFDLMESATFGPAGDPFIGGPTRVYFAGARLGGALLDLDMAVLCFDLNSSDGKCSGWPSTSYRMVAFDHGGFKADMANAIEYDPDGYLFIAGKISNSSGTAIGSAKLSAASGNLVTTYGTGGKAWYALNGSGYDPEIIASAFAGADTPGGKRFYVSGSYRPGTDASDRDGFVLSLNVGNGTYLLKQVYYEADNTGWKKDEVTALAVLKSGKVVYAGWSETDQADYPSLLLGRATAITLGGDASFCGGGLCSHPQSSLFGGTRKVRPRAIAARRSNGDLLLALDGQRRDTVVTGPWRPRQLLQLWDSTGRFQRSGTRNDFPAATDAHIEAWSGPVEVTDSDVLLAGRRRWSDNNIDVTAARHLRLDSIFAHDFGGPTSD